MTGGAAYDTWRLVSLSPLPGWARGALLFAVTAAVVLAALGLKREVRRARKALLLALRVASALAIAALVLEPGVELVQTMRTRSRLLVLLDTSQSMAFPAAPPGGGKPPPTRAEAAARWLDGRRDELRDLERRFDVEYFTFDSAPSAAGFDRLTASAAPEGKRTDILGSLIAAFQGGGAAAGRKAAAALVVSDGADNGLLADGIGPAQKAALQALGAPVSAVLVGEAGVKDLAVAAVRSDAFAFVRNPITVEVEVVSQGFSGGSVPVVLTHEGRVVATQTLALGPGRRRYSVSFKLSPDRTGELVYTVSVPPQPGEATADNNQRAFVVKVIRDRVRVLLVCGRPSWDERFLRGLLRDDPNVDLVSFFILRDPGDDPHARQDELSLIPFPTEEIFEKQIDTFDLVILQDFAWLPFSAEESALGVDRYFSSIERYVEGGGALLMIGGENSFGDGHWDQTPVENVLPVVGAGLPPSEERFAVRLTGEGRRHPVTAIAEDGEASARAWASLPPIAGLNLVRAKPGARVLLEHSLLSVGGANAPVLVAAEEGRGRSLALMTDSSWFWSLPAEGQGITSRAYDHFWNNAIRWLVHDPDLTQLRIEAERRTVAPGEPIALDVTAREADYGPAAGAAVQVRLLDAETAKAVASAAATARPDGRARVELSGVPPGAYRVVASATDSNGAPLGETEDALAVRRSGPEMDDPLPRPGLLREIARVTGGSYGELPAHVPALHALAPDVVEIGRREGRPIWDNVWPLLGLCLTLGLEWWLRRRWGWA